ncbi:hypothetical protein M378DRAFT_75115 [Amanita muscaria Koide BX008]|uniref:HAT C-terminal dimerisation domain-containing protein n=1 Tax=Amanita muscaria (strain Koide BX008) TaxID=946122 RepID=A0A0C2THW7_AMAMK|nr:hypothetical protein M378DRAFT_75115 [Amanita muscaria Koide BX008]
MTLDPEYAPVSAALKKGLEKINKWHQVVETTNMYFICLALDPCVKLEYCRNQWDSGKFSKGERAFQNVFDIYAGCYQVHKPAGTKSSMVPAPMPQGTKGYGMSFLQKAIQAKQSASQPILNPHQELVDYLAAPLEDITTTDIVHWWGYRQVQYPILSRMARDYLAIQGSSVASERAFSSGGLTTTLLRNKLKPEHVEALQMVKNGYKNGWINATKDAKQHEPYSWAAHKAV